MSKKKTDAAAAAEASAPAMVRVRITKNATTACGFVFAAGAMVSLPADKAEALEKLGRGVIVGV